MTPTESQPADRSAARRPGEWTLFAYFAGRWDATAAAVCVVSAASPLLVLAFRRAVGVGGPLGPAFLLAASAAPAVVAVSAWSLLWGGFSKTYLPAPAAALLRITGDGRRLFRGIAGWVLARCLVALLAAAASVIVVAIASGEPAFVFAAAASSLAGVLLYEAAMLPVRVAELHGQTWASVVSTGIVAAGWLLYLKGGRRLYFEAVAVLESPAATTLAGVAVAAGCLAFAGGWRIAERRMGAVSDRFGVGTPDEKEADRLVVTRPRRRRPRPLWSHRPGVVLAYRRVVFGGVGMAAATATVAAVVFAGAALVTGPRASRVGLAAESLTFGAWVVAVGGAIGLAAGPMHAIASEKEEGTFGLLALACGRAEAVRSLADGTRMGVAVVTAPALLWVASRAAFVSPWPWWAFAVAAAVGAFVWSASVYGVWAAARSPGLSEAVGIWVVAVAAFPMLLYAPRLLRRELRRPAAIEAG